MHPIWTNLHIHWNNTNTNTNTEQKTTTDKNLTVHIGILVRNCVNNINCIIFFVEFGTHLKVTGFKDDATISYHRYRNKQ